MKKKIILILLSCIILSSCEKDITNANAEVISFNPDKCGCCWGWTINQNGNEFKTNSSIVGLIVGSEIDTPIPVHIEKGKKEESCSNYFEINKIELID